MKRIRENEDDFSAMQASIQPLIDERLSEIDELNAQPHEYSEDVLKRIRKILRNQQKCSRIRMITSHSRRIASIALIAGTVLLTAALSIQPIRAGIWEFLITGYDEYLEIQFSEELQKNSPKSIEKQILPTDLPEGWRIEIFAKNRIMSWYQIYGPADEYISYRQKIIAGTHWFDSTDMIMEKIRLNDRTDAHIMTYVEGDITIHWIDTYEFTISGDNMSREQLIAFAENIDSQNH